MAFSLGTAPPARPWTTHTSVAGATARALAQRGTLQRVQSPENQQTHYYLAAADPVADGADDGAALVIDVRELRDNMAVVAEHYAREFQTRCTQLMHGRGLEWSAETFGRMLSLDVLPAGNNSVLRRFIEQLPDGWFRLHRIGRAQRLLLIDCLIEGVAAQILDGHRDRSWLARDPDELLHGELVELEGQTLYGLFRIWGFRSEIDNEDEAFACAAAQKAVQMLWKSRPGRRPTPLIDRSSWSVQGLVPPPAAPTTLDEALAGIAGAQVGTVREVDGRDGVVAVRRAPAAEPAEPEPAILVDIVDARALRRELTDLATTSSVGTVLGSEATSDPLVMLRRLFEAEAGIINPLALLALCKALARTHATPDREAAFVDCAVADIVQAAVYGDFNYGRGSKTVGERMAVARRTARTWARILQTERDWDPVLAATLRTVAAESLAPKKKAQNRRPTARRRPSRWTVTGKPASSTTFGRGKRAVRTIRIVSRWL